MCVSLSTLGQVNPVTWVVQNPVPAAESNVAEPQSLGKQNQNVETQ